MMRTGVFVFCILTSFGGQAIAGERQNSLPNGPRRLIVPHQDPNRAPVLELVQDGPLLSVTIDGNPVYTGPGAISQQGSSSSGSMFLIQTQGFALGFGVPGALGTGGGGGGTSNLQGGGGSSGSQHDDLLALVARVSCPLDAESYTIESLLGVNLQNPSTIHCPNHPYFGLTEEALERWEANHQPTLIPGSNGQIIHAIDTDEYEMACMPMQMRCPIDRVVFDPQALGLDMAAPLTWGCPLHASLVTGQGNVEGQFLTFVSSCVQPEDPPVVPPPVDPHGQEKAKPKVSKKKQKEETILLSGAFFLSFPEATTEISNRVSSAISEASSQEPGSFPTGDLGSDAGGWGEAEYSRHGGGGPSLGGGGNDSDARWEFRRTDSFVAEASSSVSSSEASASRLEIVAQPSAVASGLNTQASVPNTQDEAEENAVEESVVRESGLLALCALLVFGLAMALLLVRVRRATAPSIVLRRRLPMAQVAPARIATPVILAQPRKAADWTRYRHLVTDVVEDAMLAVRGWIASTAPKSNRVAHPIEAAPVEEPVCANRIAKKEMQESLS